MTGITVRGPVSDLEDQKMSKDCFNPRRGWVSRTGGFTMNRRNAWEDREMTMPCGKCINCAYKRSEQFLVRQVCEVKTSDPLAEHLFATLTYDDENLPVGGSLVRKDAKDFLKLLRYHLGRITYFGSGEYGSLTHRPHFHFNLFDIEIPDLEKFKKLDSGQMLYVSEKISEIWGKGQVTLGRFTAGTAGYVAGYVGKRIPEHLLQGREKEFRMVSNHLGLEYYKRYKHQFFNNGFILIDGKKRNIPEYYCKLYKEEHPEKYLQYVLKRKFSGDDEVKERERAKKRLGQREEYAITVHKQFSKKNAEV